eukprot:superscaffoldBa00004024_g18126
MSVVYLGKWLLEAVRTGQDDDVRALMTNWGSIQHRLVTDICSHRLPFIYLFFLFFPFPITGGHHASVQNGTNIHAKDMLKMTVLHWTAQRGHRVVAEFPLSNGADVHCLNKFDKTPFYISHGYQQH